MKYNNIKDTNVLIKCEYNMKNISLFNFHTKILENATTTSWYSMNFRIETIIKFHFTKYCKYLNFVGA